MTAGTPAPTYPDTVPYATPAPRPVPKVWAGTAIVCGGLCLMILGGCFLIGVMALVQPSALGSFGSPPTMTAPQIALMGVLYLLAALSFGGAATLLFIGTRALLRVMRT